LAQVAAVKAGGGGLTAAKTQRRGQWSGLQIALEGICGGCGACSTSGKVDSSVQRSSLPLLQLHVLPVCLAEPGFHLAAPGIFAVCRRDVLPVPCCNSDSSQHSPPPIR